ncbi:hypothetical protein L2Y90_20500 [Burkholderia pyrrocinia]|uniref:hypothetical protein n=1 Tax=Burkholderia pyrrocinia TaxID=60550 RepID=UPI00215A7BDC|nr:hypothetical protein [Burkholderia pyrrocinia]UVE69135.1 hypothetical protein L2Y90_20500 [Burkholderia pyrrocinia]
MKKQVLFFLLTILLSVARAQVVRSCDGRYSAEVADRAEMIIKRDGRKIGVVKIDHNIDSGVFSLDERSFVVYGMPSKIDHRSPQAEFISIYLLKPKLRMIMKRTYGGGVYDVAIGSDQKSIFVSSRFGFDVIDIRDMKIKSYDPISEPKFSRQQCKN